MIDLDDIRCRYQKAEPFLDERGRRLFAANEALAHGYGGVTATAVATGLARSTINRGIGELRSGRNWDCPALVDTLKLSPEVFHYAEDPTTVCAGVPASDD